MLITISTRVFFKLYYFKRSLRNRFLVYENNHKFEIGKANFIKDGDSVAVFGCGITLHNALEAAELLAKENINISVIDPFTGLSYVLI